MLRDTFATSRNCTPVGRQVTLIGRVALAILAILVAGCGGNGESARAPETQARAPVIEVEDEPRATTPLAEVQEASIALPGGPDWMTSHRGFVWVERDDGIVTRLDPRTDKPRGEVRADTKSDQFCQGIGSGGGAVWSCSGSDVVRIDPKRLKVVASIPVGKVFDQGRLVFAAGKIWVIAGEGDRLVGIDTSTEEVGPTIELGETCNELGPGRDTVWVLCRTAGTVLAVDPLGASVRGKVALADPAAAFATERDLWVAYEDGLARIDAVSLEQVARFDIDAGAEGDLVLDGDDVWVRTASGFLHRIDATSNTVAERIEPEDALSGGAVLVHEGSVWTTAFDDNLVIRLRGSE